MGMKFLDSFISYRTSKKSYICEECSNTIKINSKYRKDFIRMYNNYETHIMCMKCNDLLNWYLQINKKPLSIDLWLTKKTGNIHL